ncbi:type VI secretion system membrane subunit TssM [Duganella qianjiadongensis]|uniref:Type VI secretion system membrane subunit TssM n=1 Tax=Duganella qianjiadongensis TaxID=2692176 RepID=A0ABW9VQK4_9BURK|nr:type VI secretion system membrane subunit TssM [Duganella qianjiadongensis]MYM41856.1 type VI secretion system membrane subunit TssM [Duganella qianjiadongensis]
MMRRLWYFLTEPRQLALAGLAAAMAVCFVGAQLLELALLWAVLAVLLLVLGALLVWLWRRRHAARETAQLASAIGDAASGQESLQQERSGEELRQLREALLKAIATLRSSRLGAVSGQRALYELPWYMVIGNPAAGKSTAIANSGLQFPVAEGKVLQGVGGTRQCDWFFTTEGILLDTAGRYSVQDEHRPEWYGFLDLLRKHRQRAPINGILIAVSIAELRAADPAAGIQLARSLRKRVQDLIERLQVFAPVYVVFTKADLIAGFGDFFASTERSERERVWGATMPYKRKSASQQIMAFFDQSFDELCAGLKDLSIANMSQQRRERMAPGIFTFPQEFATIRAPLRAFLATLFEENPYQFKPVFRGYYFTSALQEGQSDSAQAQRLAQRYALGRADVPRTQEAGQSGYFLLQLFRQVIFADKDLVSHYASRRRVRLSYAVFFVAVLLLGTALGGWSWSYLSNRQLVNNVQADLDKVLRLQDKRIDLQARLEALEILQDRLEQLERYRNDRPWSLRFGLYQGELLEQKLRAEYFAGVRQIMLAPVVANLEALLAEMNAHADQLQLAPAPTAGTTGRQFQDASPLNVDDSYNALKSYLMLADPSHAEAGHLNDQLTRYWRGWLESNRGNMTREQLVRSAERLMTFYLGQIADPAWPRIETRLALVDQARENLRRVVRGLPARERVYGEIRARANTRFPALTVARMVGEQDQALITGSSVVNGAYTREAWEKFVQPALREAATHDLQSADWVLKSAARDDLTLEGSPEQIQKGLLQLYQADYVREWQKFVQGVNIAPLHGFDAAVVAVNRLGDPVASPLLKLFSSIAQQTSWDNAGTARAEVAQARSGLLEWFNSVVLRRTSPPASINVPLPAAGAAGTIGREFSVFSHLVAGGDKDATLMRTYLEALARVRGRLNQLKNQGDPGPGARQLMQQTLEGTGSELADALRLVDEQMLTGASDAHKQLLRPLLVRPLMQTFAVLVAPVEAELNKTWVAQVYGPFRQSLAHKYPFSPAAREEASAEDIGRIFGPEGAIARYSSSVMGALVIRRGDLLAARTWAEMGIQLSPAMAARLAGWMAPAGTAAATARSTAAQTLFQLQPMPAQGAMEYTIDIDGQQLRYRNTPPQWASMVHPAGQGGSGARITAVALDGRSIEVFNESGPAGLKRMIEAASKQKREGGVFELHWQAGGLNIPVALKIISSPESAVAESGESGLRGLQLPESIVGAQP